MYPSSAMSPSKKEYAGSIALLRRMTPGPLELNTPVNEWGYRNSASADPRASVAYALDWPRVPGLGGVRMSFAGGTAAKIAAYPPSFDGMIITAAATVT
jgi:hypothetical protein